MRAPRTTPLSRHVLDRFSAGWTPALQRRCARAGGPLAWFEEQLEPDRAGVPDQFFGASRGWWLSNTLTAPEIWRRHTDGTEDFWWSGTNYQRWVIARRTFSERQLLEVVADMWENHLHVPCAGEAEALYRASYGETVRRHALGPFDDLLVAAITHPAMGAYLNNAVSTGKAPNEDLGRELLEVHTVGRGAYTEDDVKSSARILTGWRVGVWRDWQHAYDPASHWVGPVQVMGFSDPNASPDGRAVSERYLRWLARHPSTAQRIARVIALRFVSDTPSDGLVDELAAIYLASGTDVRPVLRRLVRHPEFRASVGLKVRTPEEDLVATYRALGVRWAPPRSDESMANATVWQADGAGLAPFSWPRPDGRPDSGEAWASTSRVLASFDAHMTLAGGWWPKVDATYRSPKAWLPAPSVPFHALVDNVARLLTGQPATSALQRAAVRATGVAADEVVDADRGLVRWGMPRLLATVLDSPAHLTR